MTALPKTSSNATQVPSLTSYPTKALPVRSDFRTRAVLATLMLVTGSVFCGRARAEGDPAAGKAVFATQCSSCHTTEVGKNGFGPSLAAGIGRRAGHLAGSSSRPAMGRAGLTWDAKSLES